MTASVQSYAYLRPSGVRGSGAGSTLALETSGGAATAGAAAHLRFFDGFLTAPAAAAAALLAVAEVAASRFDQSAGACADPVVMNSRSRPSTAGSWRNGSRCRGAGCAASPRPR